MSAKPSPARQLLLSLEDEGGVADLALDEILADLQALGIDPAPAVAAVRKQAARPAAMLRQTQQPRPPDPEPEPEPEPEPQPASPPLPTTQPQIYRDPEPVSEPPPVTPRPAVASYRTPEPATDLMADMRIRAGGAEAIERDEKPKRKGRPVVTLIGSLALVATLAAVTVAFWPEVRDLDPESLLARIDPPQQAPPAEPATTDSVQESEVTITRVEPVPPPEPAPAPEPEPPPAPAPEAQAVAPAPATQAPAAQPPAQATTAAPAAQSPAAADPNAPLNIVPKVEAPPVQEARLPENVERPFTAPPSITTVVPVERELLAEAGTGILSSGARSGGSGSDESRLSGRLEEAQRIAAGRQIAALVAMRSAEGDYDAVILKRPRVDETRTIADADPALIPILGDTAHLFDLVRLAPR